MQSFNSYDMRNMLTETRHRHFSERLYYADSLSSMPAATACYNGNISAMRITQGDTAFTFYYTYDTQNRLVESEQDRNGQKVPNEWFQYDARGNITALHRYCGPRLMDELTFSYQEDGNQLLSVLDYGLDVDRNSIIEYQNLHNATTNSPDMLYDANGNLIFDADRGISVIHYNILNLPDTIQFVNGDQIVNLYDATGRKYKSVVFTVPSTAVVPQYEIVHYPYGIDSILYLITDYSGNIETIYTAEDTLTRRIHNNIGYHANGIYYHYIKDHLGNICAVVNSEADTLVQSTIYYASGVPMAENLGPDVAPSYYMAMGIQYTENFGRDKQPYLYNGKEFVEAHGLNEYEYGFRNYYSPIGRFTTVDPLAEQTPWQSPYSYARNHFINAIDWMGLSGLMSGYTSSYGWMSSNFTASSWGGLGSLIDILNYIIVDEDGIVLESDLTSPDRGIYQVNRTLFEGYVNNVINGNHLLFAQTFGTQVGVHREMPLGTVLRGMTLDQSWYNPSATLGIVNSFYIPFPDFTPEPVTGKIHSARMPFDAYMEILIDKQGLFQPMDYMQYYNSFERGMITSPVIQGVAVGGLGVMTIESVSLTYFMLQNSIQLQFFAGILEGVGKSKMDIGPYVPYLYAFPAFQIGSDIGSWICEFLSNN